MSRLPPSPVPLSLSPKGSLDGLQQHYSYLLGQLPGTRISNALQQPARLETFLPVNKYVLQSEHQNLTQAERKMKGGRGELPRKRKCPLRSWRHIFKGRRIEWYQKRDEQVIICNILVYTKEEKELDCNHGHIKKRCLTAALSGSACYLVEVASFRHLWTPSERKSGS